MHGRMLLFDFGPGASELSQEGNAPPLVSVVIASYNAAPTLPATLESVLAQSYSNLEVIVVDDGSTDDTPALLARQFPQIGCIRKANGGLPTARNCGCFAANGEFVALMDADDICHPDRISVQVAFMLARPDILLCSSEFSAFNAEGPIGETYARDYYSQIAETPGGIKTLFGEHTVLDLRNTGIALHSTDSRFPVYVGSCYESLAHGNFIHPPTVLFRRETLEQCGRFDESIRNMCDWDWLVRVARLGKFGYIDFPLLNYRLSESQLSGSENGLQASLDILKIRENIVRMDSELRMRFRPVLDRAIGLAAIAAADASLERNRMLGLRLLGRALSHRGFGKKWVKVALKALVPRNALGLLRGVRRTSRFIATRNP